MLLLTMMATLADQPSARPCAGPEPHTEAAVRAAEDRWVHLLETRNVGGLACLLAPEFTDTNWAGQSVSRASILMALLHRHDSMLTFSDIAIVLHGDVAIVHGLNRQIDATGKPTGVVRFTDIFFYRDRRWQAVSAQETPVRAPQ